MSAEADLLALSARLAALEARVQRGDDQHAIRACVNRYMALCDRLDADTDLPALLDLFTEDALWRGKGARYAVSFGGYQGRAAIGEMFSRYMRTPPHFALNVHFLCSELIEPEGDQARASWVMLQTSTFASGDSHLNAAELSLQLQRGADGRWRIALFETENLFSRPVSAWRDASALPVPAAQATPSAASAA
ncbi:nuclear transport factor 2 family protein [Curvibacter sp. HBC28]|uniref:Nuclear transport factor 2 family protein n=1 Tax=Curvibacter microcysteis TaxID=3026419 RepID=A0ABT5MAS1_9BURK|nr:nuclear transport factor 2 family protein [Curvibacter sp. HBC28]MDD0813686.1 nuclear transport factor 2 family protein [Curvibacter sp. HBC28]